MNVASAYVLPALVGEQYVLSSVLQETSDTVLYAATQKDMRRDVVVESLAPEAAADPMRVQQFLETAKAQARFGGGNIAAPLELLYADNTWHLAKECIKGDSLDALMVNGEKLTSSAVCDVMLHLCHICLCLDIERIDNQPFSLQDIYRVGVEFRFDNLARAGERSRSASRRTLAGVAGLILPLLDMETPLAGKVRGVLSRMQLKVHWSALSPVLYDEEFTRLQFQILLEERRLSESLISKEVSDLAPPSERC